MATQLGRHRFELFLKDSLESCYELCCLFHCKAQWWQQSYYVCATYSCKYMLIEK